MARADKNWEKERASQVRTEIKSLMRINHPNVMKFMARADKNWEKEQASQVRTEIKSLMRINHSNVMRLYAYNLNCKYPEKTGAKLQTILLVLEYCPGGELFD